MNKIEKIINKINFKIIKTSNRFKIINKINKFKTII